MLDVALRRVLKVGPVRWRIIELLLAGTELAVGLVFWIRTPELIGAIMMTALGAVFMAAIFLIRRRVVGGSCGCFGWQHESDGRDWRVMVRACWILAAGLAGMAATGHREPAFTDVGFDAGLVTTGMMLAPLGIRWPPRRSRCGRRFWLPTCDARATLVAHAVFATVGDEYGPIGREIGHRRTGCADQFWFEAGPDGTAPAFRFEVTRGIGRSAGVLATVPARHSALQPFSTGGV
jgi:hypothetical protein